MFKMCANLYNYRSTQRPVILFMGIKEIDRKYIQVRCKKSPQKFSNLSAKYGVVVRRQLVDRDIDWRWGEITSLALSKS